MANPREDFPRPTLAAAYAGYGLGWVAGDYHGQRMLSHFGSTLGFEAQLAIWPAAELDTVIALSWWRVSSRSQLLTPGSTPLHNRA